MIGTTATSRGTTEVCEMIDRASLTVCRAVQALGSGIGRVALKVKDGEM